MTKITVLGECVAEKPKKKIEFIFHLDREGTCKTVTDPKSCSEIVLIEKKYRGDIYDLFFVKREEGNSSLYLGYFNDGIV